jgi:hypothetical protein
MDVIDPVCLWVVHRWINGRRQKKDRKFWVHSIIRNVLSFSLFVTLRVYPRLTLTHFSTTLECSLNNPMTQ